MKRLLFTLTLFLAVVGTAGAQPRQISSLAPSAAQINMARVQKVFTLKNGESFETRINLLVLESESVNGDVSPRIELYLTFWRDTEQNNLLAVFPLGETFSLADFKKVPGGVTLMFRDHNDSKFVVKEIKVDYSRFARQFEAARDGVAIARDSLVETVNGKIQID